jgi:hypothetical protein
MELIPDALSSSLEMLDQRRRDAVAQEAAEREWPSVVLEDLLDADVVKERTKPPLSIVWPFGPTC